MFEKYDGVRAFWHPKEKKFFSRNGRPFALPQEVIACMPEDIFLDGELWFGTEKFDEAMKIANRVDSSKVDWRTFKYMVFDIPNHPGRYSGRYHALGTFLLLFYPTHQF